jgi:hypothetical protein
MVSSPLPAQEISELTGKDTWERVWISIQTEWLNQVRDGLSLQKDQADRLIPKLRSLDEKKRNIGKQKLILMRGLKVGIKTMDANGKQTDWFLYQLEENKKAEVKVGEEAQRILKEILTPAQQAQYLISRQEFKKRLRAMILAGRD